MHESTDIEAVSTEALRKLGRNILNFSKIEASFKLLLSVNHVEGTTKTIGDKLKDRQRKLRKKSLGNLVTEFNKSIFRDVKKPQPPGGLSKPWFSLSLTIPSEHSKEWKQTLRALVKERNRLIHQDLAQIDVASSEDYRNLISLLDEQNPRLLAHLDDLRWMLCSLSETVQSIQQSPELLQFLASPEEAKAEVSVVSTSLQDTKGSENT